MTQYSSIGDQERQSFSVSVTPIFHWFLCSFFFLSLVIPTAYRNQRGALLLLLILFVIGYYSANRRAYLNKYTILWAALCIFASLFQILNGAIQNAPGALSVLTVYVAWPMLFLFFMGLPSSSKAYVKLIKTIILGTAVAAISGIAMVFDIFFGLGLGVSDLLGSETSQVGIYEGNIEYSLANITTMIYGVPFLIALLVLPNVSSVIGTRWKMFAALTLLLCLIAIPITGRRAAFVITAAAPIVSAALAMLAGISTRFAKLSMIWVVPISVLVIFGFPIIGLNIDAMIESFLTGFSGQESESSSVRVEQFWALINDWSFRPIFGYGHGAASTSFVRDPNMPWAYELSYVALLFQTGLFGLTVYGSAIFWIFASGISIMRRQADSAFFILPTLSGLFCFLVANATNPYLSKFDYLWVIFLPVGVLNLFLSRKY